MTALEGHLAAKSAELSNLSGKHVELSDKSSCEKLQSATVATF